MWANKAEVCVAREGCLTGVLFVSRLGAPVGRFEVRVTGGVA